MYELHKKLKTMKERKLELEVGHELNTHMTKTYFTEKSVKSAGMSGETAA